MDTLQVTFVSRYITADSPDSAAGCWCWLVCASVGKHSGNVGIPNTAALLPGHSKRGHLNILHEDKHCLKIQVVLIQMEVCGKHCTENICVDMH